MKFATHVLVFNQDHFLDKHLSNVGPHVDTIYLTWSKLPWLYNKKAREQFINNFDPSSLDDHPYREKIKIIEGVWDSETEQRNLCVDLAKKDEHDILFIIDADEFYLKEDFDILKKGIKANMSSDFFITPWISFWKNFQTIIVDSEGSAILGYPQVALNLTKDVKFSNKRGIEGVAKQLSSICFHGSFVISDEQCWEKINTWGHTHQFKVKKWYNNKWLNWDINSINLHPVNPKAWARTIQYDQELPEVLYELLDENITSPHETKKRRSIWKKIVDRATICKLFIIYLMV